MLHSWIHYLECANNRNPFANQGIDGGGFAHSAFANDENCERIHIALP